MITLLHGILLSRLKIAVISALDGCVSVMLQYNILNYTQNNITTPIHNRNKIKINLLHALSRTGAPPQLGTHHITF